MMGVNEQNHIYNKLWRLAREEGFTHFTRALDDLLMEVRADTYAGAYEEGRDDGFNAAITHGGAIG